MSLKKFIFEESPEKSPDKLLEPLKISQKKAARAACNVKGSAHSASCFQNLEALQFNDMYKLACAKVAVLSSVLHKD